MAAILGKSFGGINTATLLFGGVLLSHFFRCYALSMTAVQLSSTNVFMRAWNSRIVRIGIFAALAILIVSIHLLRIDTVPRGVYQDEAAIGINALSIAHDGRDEHGEVFPLFFESFGDYKAPVYIYTAALLFRVAPPSTAILRLTSAFYVLLLVTAVVLLVRRLTMHRQTVAAYALLAAGTLPWFFTLSRISFEVISQAALTATALLTLWYAFCPATKHALGWSAATGILLALSVYAYPTGRIIGFGLLAIMLLFYARRSTVRQALVITCSFAICLVPYLLYVLRHADHLTARFNGMTFVFDPSLSFIQKAMIFLGNYVAHFTPAFLLLQGDGNLRHAIGFGGEIFLTVGILALTCLVLLTIRRLRVDRRFIGVLVCLMVLAPVASALTTDGIPHSLRSILLGLSLLLLSCIGFDLLLQIFSKRMYPIVALVIFLCLGTEATAYLYHYFAVYPAVSAAAFESSDLSGALQRAAAEHPQEIIVTPHINYATVRWYQTVAKLPMPVRQEELVQKPGRCLIFRNDDQAEIIGSLPFKDVSPPEGLFHVRCY